MGLSFLGATVGPCALTELVHQYTCSASVLYQRATHVTTPAVIRHRGASAFSRLLALGHATPALGADARFVGVQECLEDILDGSDVDQELLAALGGPWWHLAALGAEFPENLQLSINLESIVHIYMYIMLYVYIHIYILIYVYIYIIIEQHTAAAAGVAAAAPVPPK